MVIVDTTVWVDFLRGTRVRTEEEFGRVRKLLSEFELFETGGEQLAITAARNFRSIREKGRTVRRTIDCLIASFCLANGYPLLHRDRDFDPFEEILGLAVIHP